MINKLTSKIPDQTVDHDPDELLLIEEDDADFLIIEEDELLVIEEDEEPSPPSADPTLLTQASAIAQVDLEKSTHEKESWKVIIVDDEPSVHQATALALKNFTFDGYPLEFISAYSAQEGKKIIAELNGQAASILLDVVMESQHAGLDLVEFIRNSLHNKQVRIILRTGQPGEAPPESVILDYDINDYQLKLDMTRQRLITSLVTALRSYRDIVTIEHQNQVLSETLDKLQSSENELKHYSHNLELLVSERTAALQEANDQLQRLATLDGLTQVANRRYFDHYLREQWSQAQSRQTPISLILMDVDYFKAYNDHYGHLAGDDCLKQVAQALSNALRRSQDLVARYGGEEFAVILPNANYQGACRVARDILIQIQTLQIPHAKSEVQNYLTLSMGISSLIPHANIQQESLIETADLALYQAKDKGRHQYCLYRDIAEKKED